MVRCSSGKVVVGGIGGRGSKPQAQNVRSLRFFFSNFDFINERNDTQVHIRSRTRPLHFPSSVLLPPSTHCLCFHNESSVPEVRKGPERSCRETCLPSEGIPSAAPWAGNYCLFLKVEVLVQLAKAPLLGFLREDGFTVNFSF